MKLAPVLTEKTLEQAKKGKYTFKVGKGLNKNQIKKMVEDAFDVEVEKVRTMNDAGEEKRTVLGRKRVVMPQKKAVVSLKGKDKIEIFEETS